VSANSILRACAIVLTLCLGSVSTASAQQALSPSDAAALLARVQQAARKLDYSGVFAHQQGQHMQSSRIVHVVDGSGERERIEVLDGQPREFLRHNDEVQCLIPEKKTVVKEKRRADRFPGLVADGAPNFSGYYRVTVRPDMQRIAGRDCRQIDIVPTDKLRYGYRLCMDAATDLLLKTQVVTARDGVVEQIAFTSLYFDSDVETAQLASRWQFAKWQTHEHQMRVIDLAEQGWRIASPPGFVTMTQVLRRSWRGDETVNQVLLSDGLASISVFIEPWREERSKRHRLQGAGGNGAVNAYGVRIANFWLTALGEVPLATLRSLAESTEYVPLPAPQQ